MSEDNGVAYLPQAPVGVPHDIKLNIDFTNYLDSLPSRDRRSSSIDPAVPTLNISFSIVYQQVTFPLS